jgi:hypothetical protein
MNLIKIREEETSQNRLSKLLTKLRSTEEEVSYSRKPVPPT